MTQACAKQPKIVTESLQPKATIAGYRFTWEERGLIAWAELNPIEDQPARGFLLECSYDTVSGREPGNRQIDTGTTLTGNVRELMLGQMALAGWREIGRDEQRHIIWQHSSRIASSASEQDQAAPSAPVKASRVLYVPAREGKVKDYRRTITASDVTYTCANCGDQVAKVLFPGATPKYCDDCAAKVKHEQMIERVKRYRQTHPTKKKRAS